MIDLVLTHSDQLTLFEKLVGHGTERCAVLLARQVKGKNDFRLLVREVLFPVYSDYVRSGVAEAELSPVFVAAVTQRARRDGYSLVFVHSHPGDSPPYFSVVDDDGEQRLAAFLAHRIPLATHAALVISAGGANARILGTDTDIRVVSLGPDRTVLFAPETSAYSTNSTFDRQIRAFGELGQRKLADLRVAIVGLGGTGSLIAQQLVHLGVRDFILIDPDVIEVTNLNRVVSAEPADVGQAKIQIAARYIKKMAPESQVELVLGDVTRTSTAVTLTTADFIFGCTDSHGSRAVIQQIAYQYLIPCIDMGSVLVANDGHITHISGRVQLLAPGLACFTCGGLLNAEEIRRDMLNDAERRQDPYIVGAAEPAPAVISLNGTVASIAVSMMLSVVAGTPMNPRHILFNGITLAVRPIRATPDPSCFICSVNGSLSQGDAWPLMARRE